MNQLYTIGRFSSLSKVSKDTLRFYDKIDLLKPALTEKSTSYRYYSHEQLAQLEIIKALRYMDLSIETIKELLQRKDAVAMKQTLQFQKEQLLLKMAQLKQTNAAITSMMSRLEIYEEIKQHKGIYTRIHEEQIIVRSKQIQITSKEEFFEQNLFLELIHKMSINHLVSNYEGGFYFETDNDYTLTSGRVYEVVTRTDLPSSLYLKVTPPCEYLCINYHFADRQKAFAQFNAALKKRSIHPPFFLESYLITGTFHTSNRYYELKCPLL